MTNKFIARGYKESEKMPLTDEQKALMDTYLEMIDDTIRELGVFADKLEGDGFPLVASLVRDGLDYLRDITWLDFTSDLNSEDFPNDDDDDEYDDEDENL